MNCMRLRNAARVKASIEQLGRNWVLHPDHAVTAVAHAEVRAARTEVIDLRRMPPAVAEWSIEARTPPQPKSPTLYAQRVGRVLRDRGFRPMTEAFGYAELIAQGWLKPIDPQGGAQ